MSMGHLISGTCTLTSVDSGKPSQLYLDW